MRIGIDLGGTKIEVIALNDKGIELYRERLATPQHDYHATLNAITTLITNAQTHSKQTASIGIGIPGALSATNALVKNANSTWLIGKPLKADLESQLGCAIRIENDANCFAVSEATDGAAKNAAIVFAVIIGTGTGAGLVVNKRVIVGANAIAGEWGHNPLPWPTTEELPGRQCYCGKTGCIETWLSGSGFTNDHHSRGGLGKTAQDIVKLAEQGDKIAQASLTLYEDRLARSLATIINVLDPDVIVLGGGMSNISRIYTNVPKIWHKYIFSDQVNTQLTPPVYGDSSGVRGAAWLWNI